jgi:hypothetical protein
MFEKWIGHDVREAIEPAVGFANQPDKLADTKVPSEGFQVGRSSLSNSSRSG